MPETLCGGGIRALVEGPQAFLKPVLFRQDGEARFEGLELTLLLDRESLLAFHQRPARERPLGILDDVEVVDHQRGLGEHRLDHLAAGLSAKPAGGLAGHPGGWPGAGACSSR